MAPLVDCKRRLLNVLNSIQFNFQGHSIHPRRNPASEASWLLGHSLSRDARLLATEPEREVHVQEDSPPSDGVPAEQETNVVPLRRTFDIRYFCYEFIIHSMTYIKLVDSVGQRSAAARSFVNL